MCVHPRLLYVLCMCVCVCFEEPHLMRCDNKKKSSKRTKNLLSLYGFRCISLSIKQKKVENCVVNSNCLCVYKTYVYDIKQKHLLCINQSNQKIKNVKKKTKEKILCSPKFIFPFEFILFSHHFRLNSLFFFSICFLLLLLLFDLHCFCVYYRFILLPHSTLLKHDE